MQVDAGDLRRQPHPGSRGYQDAGADIPRQARGGTFWWDFVV